jgi:hypothetical protein
VLVDEGLGNSYKSYSGEDTETETNMGVDKKSQHIKEGTKLQRQSSGGFDPKTQVKHRVNEGGKKYIIIWFHLLANFLHTAMRLYEECFED